MHCSLVICHPYIIFTNQRGICFPIVLYINFLEDTRSRLLLFNYIIYISQIWLANRSQKAIQNYVKIGRKYWTCSSWQCNNRCISNISNSVTKLRWLGWFPPHILLYLLKRQCASNTLLYPNKTTMCFKHSSLT